MATNLTTEELAAWIRLSLEPGLAPAQARHLLAAIGLPQDVYAASASALSSFIPAELAGQMKQAAGDDTRQAIRKTLDWLSHDGHTLLTLADPAYPARLLDIGDPPLVLYAAGNPHYLSRPSIAIVGARSASATGTDNARQFARYLAGQGWCIVSGLALGIDAAAHEGALQAGQDQGGTVAVMGTGIDVPYPARNEALAKRIAASGCLVSESALGTPALPYQFPKRNRLVAGLSRGVLVVEAARQSGSLITARLAGEMGREVFAIPGSIHSPLSRGCHALIKQGARLVESAQDIRDELGPARQSESLRIIRDDKPAAPPRKPRKIPVDRRDRLILDALGHDPAHLDQLQTRTGLDIATLNARLLEFELAGVVIREDDGRFSRRQRDIIDE